MPIRKTMRRSSGTPALRSTIAFCTSATHGIDDAAKLDDAAVTRALDDPAMMHGDGRIDQVAAKRSKPGKNAILVRSRETAISDHVRAKYGRKLSGFGHGGPSAEL